MRELHHHWPRHSQCSIPAVVPRIIVPGATIALTRRTVMRKAFLAPWHPLVPQVWLYALADAQRNTGVAIHNAIAVITHHHASVTAEAANLPEFAFRFHRDTSCALNTLLAAERYDAPREIFDRRSTHYMRLLDAPAQASQLVYEHTNCVAAGLVSRPEHMPGYTFDFELWRKGYIDVQRPPVYFSDDRPECIRLYVTPPPLLYAAFGGDLDWLVYHMRRRAEDATRTLRAARRRPPMGARRIERIHPWSEPRTLREPGNTRVPSFRVGARGLLGYDTYVAAAVETREFREEHRAARLARRDGDLAACFPFGTYQMRVVHGAATELSPKTTALVAAPGPLLCDIEADLQAQRRPSSHEQLRESAIELLDDVRNAIESEADQICEHADLDFEPEPRTGTPAGAGATRSRAPRGAVPTPDDASSIGVARPTVLVRHRFDRTLDDADAASARRLVVLRDRRRGRPPLNRHGADPPE